MELIRNNEVVLPDPSRLVARPFLPGAAAFAGTVSRIDRIAERVSALPGPVRRRLLDETRRRAAGLFADIEAAWLLHAAQAAEQSEPVAALDDPEARLLLGAYLTLAYAYEGAALTNPSIVPFGGDGRFVMSARAIGEGHISSIAFMSGSIDEAGKVEYDERSPFATNGRRTTPTYDRNAFEGRLLELGAANRVTSAVLDTLPERFDARQLDEVLGTVWNIDADVATLEETAKRIHWLASSNYQVSFDDSTPLSARLLSPAGPAESNGMEDARFVRFAGDNGEVTYHATYTAYDGRRILPQLITTTDFAEFRVATLAGPMAQQKGMALFPRMLSGEYAALSRRDQEGLWIMRSDDIRSWHNSELVTAPEYPWEAFQGGNCGSPLETEAGWLVITHGVGPMRRYVLGAVLLDVEDPRKVVGRLEQPLLEPEPDERFGYVPDVVYSCGSMIHAGRLIIPYGFADKGIRSASISLDDLLGSMT